MEPHFDNAIESVERTPKVEHAPVIIGIYGLPGCGKTFLLNQLKDELSTEGFSFYDGSIVIDSVVPGGLEAFQSMSTAKRMEWRENAISWISNDCIKRSTTGIVAGHLMFWKEGHDRSAKSIHTQRDLEVFTHILYLDIKPEMVMKYQLEDGKRSRHASSLRHLKEWQELEKETLQRICHSHGIFFMLLSARPSLFRVVLPLVRDFQFRSEDYNLSIAKQKLDEALTISKCNVGTFLVLDADRTLSAKDATACFWTTLRTDSTMCPLKKLFSSDWGYSFKAFYQATLLYEEAECDKNFDRICQLVANSITMHSEFVSFIRLIAKQDKVQTIVITCGLHRVWEKILTKYELADSVILIGGGRIVDKYVVDPKVKASLVAHLKHEYNGYVWAIGDSPLDLRMMREADRAIVVVGEEHSRSKTMDAALLDAIDNYALQAQQVLLPKNSSPRLDTTKLPLVNILDPQFLKSIIERHPSMAVYHATELNASKLIVSSTRDATIFGSRLREAHRQMGSYLAHSLVADIIGIEPYKIAHTQGISAFGNRLLYEKQTLIVALMRGGEPMALGVSETFPLACFLHANAPEDVTLDYLVGMRTVLLVDSVVNSGKTVVEFVKQIRQLDANIMIVVVAGVGQRKAVSPGGSLELSLPLNANISLVFLRLSENRYTGKGGTDTGNRLFNTTHLS